MNNLKKIEDPRRKKIFFHSLLFTWYVFSWRPWMLVESVWYLLDRPCWAIRRRPVNTHRIRVTTSKRINTIPFELKSRLNISSGLNEKKNKRNQNFNILSLLRYSRCIFVVVRMMRSRVLIVNIDFFVVVIFDDLPTPKGKKQSGFFTFPSAFMNLSGLNASGSSHNFGSLCTKCCRGMIWAPVGIW